MTGETPNNLARTIPILVGLAALVGAVAGAFGWAFIAGARYERMQVKIEYIESETKRARDDINTKVTKDQAIDAVMLRLGSIFFHCDPFPIRGRGWFRCEISRNER